MSLNQSAIYLSSIHSVEQKKRPNISLAVILQLSALFRGKFGKESKMLLRFFYFPVSDLNNV